MLSYVFARVAGEGAQWVAWPGLVRFNPRIPSAPAEAIDGITWPWPFWITCTRRREARHAGPARLGQQTIRIGRVGEQVRLSPTGQRENASGFFQASTRHGHWFGAMFVLT